MPEELLEGRKPRQKRAIERVNLILDTAVQMILESDINSLKLNELADRAGIPVGSVYQYFPSKTAIIKRLVQDQFDRVREQSREGYARITSKREFVEHLSAGIRELCESMRDDRLFQELWAGSQADGLIRHMHDEDNVYHANLMFETASQILPEVDEEELRTQCLLCSVLIDSVVRMSVNMEPEAGAALAAECARMVVREFGLSRYL